MKLYESRAITIWSVTEREGPQRRPHELFPGLDRDRAAAILAQFPQASYAPASDRLFHTYQSFLIRRGAKHILIDTCVGENKARPPHFGYPKVDWPMNLARTGVGVEEIGLVINTHLHVDHVGWNTVLADGRWKPTFPNARYLIGRVEHDHWQAAAMAGDDMAGRILTDSIWPLIGAGCAELVAWDHRIDEDMWFTPAPGHSPGMFRVDLQDGDQRIIFAADIVHHPLQCRLPGQSTVFCQDRDAAARTRAAFFDEVADTGAIVIPEHFSWPTAGRIERDGTAFAYRYLDGRCL